MKSESKGTKPMKANNSQIDFFVWYDFGLD